MYYTVRETGVSEYIEKKSIFNGVLKRCISEEQAKSYIAEIKAANHNARHNVYAYIIGEKGEIKRYSDDGEPQGTGGLPILSVLEKNHLKDVVLVVTRYFGGVLLGASGLSRAYGKAASDAVESTTICSVIKGKELTLKMAYDTHSRVDRYFKDNNIELTDQTFDSEVTVKIKLKSDDVEKIIEEIKELSLDRVLVEKAEEKEYFYSPDGKLDEIEDRE